MVPGVVGWLFFVAAASSQTVVRPTDSFDFWVLRAGVGGDEAGDRGRLHNVEGNEFAPEPGQTAEQY